LLTPVMAGPVLVTVNAGLGPAAVAVLPAVSVAVPAASEIPSVPSPVMLESVTVRVGPEPADTAIDAAAALGAFNVMLLAESVLALNALSAYVTVYVPGPAMVDDTDGAPTDTVGAVL